MALRRQSSVRPTPNNNPRRRLSSLSLGFSILHVLLPREHGLNASQSASCAASAACTLVSSSRSGQLLVCTQPNGLFRLTVLGFRVYGWTVPLVPPSGTGSWSCWWSPEVAQDLLQCETRSTCICFLSLLINHWNVTWDSGPATHPSLVIFQGFFLCR